jgi:hypothetical protein
VRDHHRVGQDLGGTGIFLRLHHLDRPPDGIGGECLTSLEQIDQLFEKAGHPLRLGRLTGDGDLVAAQQDTDGERGFDEFQKLVAGSDQADHVVMAGNKELHR